MTEKPEIDDRLPALVFRTLGFTPGFREQRFNETGWDYQGLSNAARCPICRGSEFGIWGRPWNAERPSWLDLAVVCTECRDIFTKAQFDSTSKMRLHSWSQMAEKPPAKHSTTGPSEPPDPARATPVHADSTLLGEIEAQFGYTPSYHDPHFNSGDWTFLGDCRTTTCARPSCVGEVLKVWRKPSKSRRDRFRYWAILCPTCRILLSQAAFDMDSQNAFSQWFKALPEAQRTVKAETTPLETPTQLDPSHLILAKVTFTTVVEGFDPRPDNPNLSDRHVVAATWMHQDSHESVFVNDHGEVVARWPTDLIDSVEWLAGPPPTVNQPPSRSPEASQRHSPGTKEWRREIALKSPMAYEKWTSSEDELLATHHADGWTVKQLAESHRRRKGGITSRLVKLGLRGPEAPLVKEETTKRPPVVTPQAKQHPTPARPQESGSAELSSDVPCRHDLTLETCTFCKNDGRPSVFMSWGGSRYHASPTCPSLVAGQHEVEQRHGEVSKIINVRPGSEILEGRDPCKTCRPL
jgi:hypothetical protein